MNKKLGVTESYNLKIKELQGKLAEVSLQVQNAEEKRDNAKKQADEQAQRKDRLVKEIILLENDICNKQEVLKGIAIRAVSAEANREKYESEKEQIEKGIEGVHAILAETQKQLGLSNIELSGINKIASEKRQELVLLKDNLEKVIARNSVTEHELDGRKKEIEKREKELAEISSNQARTYREILIYGNRVEHNTLRLNKLYAAGKINIKLEIPVEEWKPLNILN